MTRRVKLSKQIIEPLHPILSKKQLEGVEDIIITSGRSGSKSSAMAIAQNYRALSKPSAHVMMRKNHNKIESTIYKEALRGLSRLGVQGRAYKAWKRPFKIQINQNGSVIYFTGSDNPDDTKGMIDDDFNIETVTIDEVNEFFKMGYDRGKEEIDNIKATFVRGNNADDFKMFYMFNPPKNPNDPVMKWLKEKKYLHDEEGNITGLNPRTKHIHVTYKDVPIEWNGKALWDTAEETKRLDEEYYRWLWLGESIGVDDVIYYMFNQDKHVKAYEGQKLFNIGIGIDYGQMNATTFNAFGIDREVPALQGILGYKHSGRTQRMKSPSEYALDLLEFIEEVEKITKDKVRFITIDPSATGFAEEVRRVLNTNNKRYITLRKAQNSVEEGISRTQVLLINNALILDPSQKGAIEEFGMYRYDPKSIERGEEKPIKDFDHDMDGIRYLVMEQHAYMKQLIKTLED